MTEQELFEEIDEEAACIGIDIDDLKEEVKE